MNEADKEPVLSFWDHLDELRACLIRMGLVTLVCALVAFLFKEEMFRIVLAPRDAGFVTYRWLDCCASWLGTGMGDALRFDVPLINTGLAQQFTIHMKTSVHVGLLCASPYLLYVLFRFVSPALYNSERRLAVRLVGAGYVMFLLGAAVSYFLIFPLTFRFLGTYQVSTEVSNIITLESYMDTLLLMNLAMGLVFEIPVVCWLLGRFGLLSASHMRRFRRHAVVAILVVAAIITPTSDVFTLLLVSFPMWTLYELSIRIIRD